MKTLFLIPFFFVACTTTTTTKPDGTITSVRSQDPKVVKAIVSGATEGATRAAIQAIEEKKSN